MLTPSIMKKQLDGETAGTGEEARLEQEWQGWVYKN